MAFVPNNLVKWSPVYPPSPDVLPLPIAPPPGLPQQWAYQGGADNMAAVQVSGYFYYFADWVNTAVYNQGNFLQVGDTINCVCSDGNVTLNVTQLVPSIETVAQGIVIPPGSIDTADLANQAVTAAKIADATITTTQISASAAITGTQLSSSAGIAGTQLSASAGIIGSQIASGTISGSNIQMSTIAGNQLIANTVGNTQVSPFLIQTLSVSVSSAQFLNAYSTPVLLVPAPVVGTIVVNTLTGILNFVTTGYSGGGSLNFQYGNVNYVFPNTGGAQATDSLDFTTLSGFTSSSIFCLQNVTIGGATTLTAQLGLYLAIDTGPYTLGDGTFTFYVNYYIAT